jgi:hypothetical protein
LDRSSLKLYRLEVDVRLADLGLFLIEMIVSLRDEHGDVVILTIDDLTPFKIADISSFGSFTNDLFPQIVDYVFLGCGDEQYSLPAVDRLNIVIDIDVTEVKIIGNKEGKFFTQEVEIAS